MKKILTKIALLFPWALVVSYLIWGRSPVTDFGIFELPSIFIVVGLPVILSLVFIAATEKWPSFSLKSKPKAILNLLNSLELQIATEADGPLNEVRTVRDWVLGKLKG